MASSAGYAWGGGSGDERMSEESDSEEEDGCGETVADSQQTSCLDFGRLCRGGGSGDERMSEESGSGE